MDNNISTDYLSQKLDSLCVTGQFIEIYHDFEEGKGFTVAKILSIRDDYVLYQCISPNGEYDGYVVDSTSDISRICIDTQYIKKIEKLKYSDTQNRSPILSDLYSDNSIDLLSILLKYSFEQKCMVSLSLLSDENPSITGLICELSTCGLSMHLIDEYGISDGSVYLRISDIRRIVSDDINARQIKKLYELQ